MIQNETMNVLYSRASERLFQSKQIPEELLNSVIQAGVHSASAGNLQPFSIIKVTDQEKNNFLMEKCNQPFIGKAPLNLLFCLDFYRLEQWAKANYAPFIMPKSLRHFWVGFQDVIIAAQSIETAANAVGLGSVYVGTIIDFLDEISTYFKLPKGVVPIVMLTMGYPQKKSQPRKKLPLDMVLHDNEYKMHSIDDINEAYISKYGTNYQPIKAEQLSYIYDVCKSVHGEDYAKKVQDQLNITKKVHTAQRYFGLHYVASHMANNNTKILDYLRKNGFEWVNDEDFPK